MGRNVYYLASFIAGIAMLGIGAVLWDRGDELTSSLSAGGGVLALLSAAVGHLWNR